MDTEDRDHFKTIAGAQVGLPLDSPKPQSADNSASAPSPAYCLNQAKVMFGCYRKDEAHDPETYCAAIAATLGLYPKAVIDFVTDPRTGIASEVKFLPNVAEVRSFCNMASARMERLAKPSYRPAPRRYDTVPPVKTPNVFVSSDARGYDKMLERAEKEPQDSYNVEHNRLCADGVRRHGIWVPLSWWAQSDRAQSTVMA